MKTTIKNMKVYITGNNDITDYNVFLNSIKQSGINITKITTTGEKGVEHLAGIYARHKYIPLCIYKSNKKNNLCNPIVANNIYEEKLQKYQIIHDVDAMIVIWNDMNENIKNMIDIALKFKIHVYLHNCNKITEAVK